MNKFSADVTAAANACKIGGFRIFFHARLHTVVHDETPPSFSRASSHQDVAGSPKRAGGLCVDRRIGYV